MPEIDDYSEPFTRLVHIWSAPVGYLFRAYQIVRAKRTA
jgi:nitrate reductase gamma subunit